MKRNFFICDVCKNQVELTRKEFGELVCCGIPMRELIPGTVDAAVEKHVPAFTRDGNKLSVTVGDVVHPMTPEHYIDWIVVAQDGFTFRKDLDVAGEPKAEFIINDGPFTVYEYCNLHGLWKAEGK